MTSEEKLNRNAPLSRKIQEQFVMLRGDLGAD